MTLLAPSSWFRCPPRFRRSPLLAVLALGTSLSLACATCGPSAQPVTDKVPPNPIATPRLVIDIFAFARVLGTVAPCGCTTEPLGGLQYAFGYIEANSTPSHRLIVEPGSFLFPDPSSAEAPTDDASWAQAEQRAAALQQRFAKLGDQLVSGVGPTDLGTPKAAAALSEWPLPRVLANSRALDAHGVVAHRLVGLGDPALGLRAGITAVIDPTLAPSLAAESPAEALKREIPAMRAAGAALTVVMVQGSRATAEDLARTVDGIDIIVTGIPLGLERTRLGAPPAQVGATWVLEPGEQSQTLSHLRLEIETQAVAKLPRPDAWTARPSTDVQTRELARIDARLAKFRDDPAADPAFVARLERERTTLAQTIATPGELIGPVIVSVEQRKVSCHNAADADAATALHNYDNWVAEQNQRRFAGVRPPPPAKGQPGYVGDDQCEACHDEAAEFWAKTRHAGAYETLVVANKQFDVSCVGCHVTGFREPGGSEVVENAGLQDIQCEQCHGPGSLHVDEPERRGKPHAIRRDAHVDVCLQCHTPEHSDTFDYTAYMRDILGPGHGAARHTTLGPGPTGRELRAAGLEQAGGGCKKM